MRVTEVEAKTKWCPAVRNSSHCISSSCMWWKWVDDQGKVAVRSDAPTPRVFHQAIKEVFGSDNYGGTWTRNSRPDGSASWTMPDFHLGGGIIGYGAEIPAWVQTKLQEIEDRLIRSGYPITLRTRRSTSYDGERTTVGVTIKWTPVPPADPSLRLGTCGKAPS